MASREKEFELDLESGGSTGEEDASLELVSSKRPKNKFLSSVLGGFLSDNESIMCKCESSSSSEISGEGMNESVELLIERNSEGEDQSQGHMALAEKACENEKHRKTNSRNALKPPRPPKGPSLDVADQKLVREIAELARRKRARIEQMKAAKKMKASKSSSSYSGISAMIITLLFFLVLIIQGITSRSVPNVSIEGSPKPAVATTEGLISVQYYKSNIPSSSYHNFAEDQVSGSGTGKEVGKLMDNVENG